MILAIPIIQKRHPLPQLPSSSGHLSKTTTLWRERSPKIPGGIIPRTDKTGVIFHIYIYTLYIYLVLYNIDVYMMIYMMIYMIYDMIYIYYIYIYIHVSYVIMFVFIYACSSSHLCIHIFLVWTPLMIQQRKKCCFRLARRTSSSWQRNGTSVASPVRFRCRWWWH